MALTRHMIIGTTVLIALLAGLVSHAFLGSAEDVPMNANVILFETPKDSYTIAHDPGETGTDRETFIKKIRDSFLRDPFETARTDETTAGEAHGG